MITISRRVAPAIAAAALLGGAALGFAWSGCRVPALVAEALSYAISLVVLAHVSRQLDGGSSDQ